MSSRRRFPRSSKISPADFERNEVIDSEFKVIEKFFLITGVIFTRSRTCCNMRGFFIACLDVIFSIFYIYITVASFYLASTSAGPHAGSHAFINAFANFSGICIRFVVLAKRRLIRKSIDVISRLDKDLSEHGESKSKKKYLYSCCACAVILPLFQMGFGMFIDDPHNSPRKYENLYLFGVFTNFSAWIRSSVIVVRTVSVILCKSLPLFTVILCTFVFTRLRDINTKFMAQLKSSIDTNSPSQIFTNYSIYYGRITKSTEQVEKSLSLISFFLYGYILSYIFSVTSFLVTKCTDINHINAVIYQLMTLFEIVVCFMVLSMRAASVNESAIGVKNVIHTLPSKQCDINPNLTATLLQLANNFANEVCMTGWGLFVINRGFILTTAGVVVSYGVILVQLGK